MAEMFSCKIDGVEKLVARLTAAVPAMKVAVKKELSAFGEDVMKDSKLIVPWDTGALAGTGKVHPVEENGETMTVTLGYGDEAVNYAMEVHENLSPNVHWKRPGSGPKYLERPLREHQKDFRARIGNAMTGAFK